MRLKAYISLRDFKSLNALCTLSIYFYVTIYKTNCTICEYFVSSFGTRRQEIVNRW